MKMHKIIKGAACIMLAGAMASCSSDYLDVNPETAQSPNMVFSTVDGAQLGLFGICAGMYCQYSDLQNYYSFNGEPQCMMIYGDIMGQDYFSWIWAGRTSTWALNWESMVNNNAWLPTIGWMYNYTIINGANNLLLRIDDAEGEENERNYIKAQALTLRAHAYTRLLQIYGPRWADSNNGEKTCIPLRLDLNTGDCPLASMGAVLDKIYADLDEAIKLYESSGLRRAYNWEPDKSIACGVYTRAALLKDDWAKAQEMAKNAREGYKIMTAEEYKSGFAHATSEYMWNNVDSFENVAYFAWGSWYACNGPYPCVWGHGPGAINYDLYKQIPDAGKANCYKDLFFTPDKRLMPGLNSSNFWSEDYVDPVNMNMNGKNQRMKNTLASYNRTNRPAIATTEWPAANTPTNDADASGSVIIPFGAQYKFWGSDGYGTSAFPYMRASEMLLAEAEAAYHNGQESVAVSLINELAKNRVEGYTCTASGEKLLDEIRIWRRIELWGEGHSWFDLKRWGLPMERRAWEKDNPESNNIPKTWAVKKMPSDNDGWVWAIPQSETQYNHAIR